MRYLKRIIDNPINWPLSQIPFKTEFVTVVKRLMKTKFDKEARINFSDRIEFISDKSRLTGGKKRTLVFENGNSDLESVNAKGFLKNEIRVAVKQGLPNTTSE